MNGLSVGIEVSKSKDPSPYTSPQYDAILALLRALLGREATAPGRARTRSDIAITVGVTEVVAHSDVRWQDAADVLGGRDDPGLAFDWGRVEAAGLGLQRTRLLAPILGDPPSGPISGGRRAPTALWQAQRLADLAEYRGPLVELRRVAKR